jgi:hypothetical protein
MPSQNRGGGVEGCGERGLVSPRACRVGPVGVIKHFEAETIEILDHWMQMFQHSIRGLL